MKNLSTLEKILDGAVKNYGATNSCDDKQTHDWFIDPSAKQDYIRFVDIKCKNCKTNLAIALRFFAGMQDHG